MLKFLFKYFVELTGNSTASSLLQSFSKSRISRPLVRPFASVYHINKDEMEYPIKKYKSIHDLFTRRLKTDKRIIDNTKNTIVSPVDGVVNDLGEIASDQTFYIKKQKYHLADVFENTEKATKYENGFFFIIYLSPTHYHRIHYPINGRLNSRWALGEKSFPVNSLGEKFGNKPFSTNYRLISELDTDFGQIAVVKVGALNINSIQLTNKSKFFKKGDDLGYFSFGSTVILFIEKTQPFSPLIKKGTEVKMGEAIGNW